MDSSVDPPAELMFNDRIITWPMAGEGMALEDRKLIRTRKARPKDGPAPTIDELRAALSDDDLFRMKRVPEDGERLLLGVADWQTFLSKTFRCTDYRNNAAIRRVLQNWTFLESAIGRLQYYAKRLEHPMPIVCGRWLCHRRVADFTAVPCTAAEAVRHQAMLERGLAALNDWLRPAARRFGILANGQADRAVTADVREELYRATAPPPPDYMQSAPPVPVLETTASTVDVPAPTTSVRNRKGKMIDARMFNTLTRKPDSLNWTARQWGVHLTCSPSTVVGTNTWKKQIKLLRALAKEERRS